MAQEYVTTKIQKRFFPENIFSVINSIGRIEVLKALKWNDMSYVQLRKLCMKYTKKDNSYYHNVIAYHLRILKQYNLISIHSNGTYFLTVKGSRVLKGIMMIAESEMFI